MAGETDDPLERDCPACGAAAGERCRNANGRPARRTHVGRIDAARGPKGRQRMTPREWAELSREQFLVAKLEQLHEQIDLAELSGDFACVTGLQKQTADIRRQLDDERERLRVLRAEEEAAAAARAENMTPEQLREALRREARGWPDELREVVIEVHGEIHQRRARWERVGNRPIDDEQEGTAA